MNMHSNDVLALELMAEQAVRSHSIDGDNINSDTIHDAVFPDVFGEAVDDERFEHCEAAEISDVLHEAISSTYWKLVDEANGIVVYHAVTYTQVMQTFRNLLEQENLDEGFDNEYVRGGVNLIADCFGKFEMDVGTRMEEVLQELRGMSIT